MTASKRMRPDAKAYIVDTRKPVIVELKAWSMKQRMVVPEGVGVSHLAFDLAVKGLPWMKDRQGRPIPEFLVLIGRTPKDAIRRSLRNIDRYIRAAEEGVKRGNAKKAAVAALLEVNPS